MNAAGGFLQHLDEKGIARSKREQERLHQLTKPERVPAREDDLPSVDSHSEVDESWSLRTEDEDDNISGDDTASSTFSSQRTRRRIARAASDDEEKPYETMPRKHKKSWGSSEDEKGVSRLPIKLQDGKVVHSVHKVIPRRQEEEETSGEELRLKEEQNVQVREDVATGARFGRPAVVDIISTKSRKARVQQAKEQIASICQDIVADSENSIGLLRRLHTFCLPHVSTPSHPDPVPNDVLVRRLAILSQLAVFKDIVPGYRIRPLTDKEKAEKVSQIVQRTRDFEQGLVSVYHAYLRVLEAELKAKSELAESALQCICQLLSDLTHFNFRVNLMTVVVARLSRKVWDESSELCLKTLTFVFRTDTIGQASLEIVRLLNRMIKERHFNVHPNVMFCLLDLRLKTELGGIRASQSRADKERPGETMSKGKAAARRAKGKSTPQPHVSKKALKKLKETKAIEDEMREANAEVDLEERMSVQTETLKLLFVLYFRILKSDKPTPLLPAALQGISRFAHLVNIDFFKDLLQVLRDHVSHSTYTIETKENAEQEIEGSIPDVEYMHHRLHCIVTAFELLSGQGEALNLDLTDFINHLYALILPLSSTPGIEEPGQRSDTLANMLFRALNLVFFSRSPSAKSPPWRTAAFAKRLLIASLHFPATTAARTVDFVRSLFVKEPKLDALLSIEDRITNGVYRPDVDDPQLCNPFATNLWELQLLIERHADLEVRRLAEGLLQYSRDHN
ncbi:nucleolar complex-associated protein 3 [Fomitiporia mediterranea MF3/22]|uniref:nucleolar complex-associated protein 3 n=1 Tax=Fomitiporia mediterranea (strain MF3/22) TaxID=694068 RepID=UPI0004409B21|nr:nucleolar complex-associated protein 3 [Fomitiporia mediterranea MF3/22]EJD06019.1 nucleolar complex-associated protein 3 [Fomitiporia mediterranea MF3/22]